MAKALSTAEARDLLTLARKHVRLRARTETYWEHADRFAAAFLGRPLGVEPHYCNAVATDAAVAIDSWYECLVLDGEKAVPDLKKSTRRLQEMVDPPAAACALPALRTELERSSCSLLEVACAILAAITTLGGESLSRRVPSEVADGWLAFWQESAWKHNYQQEMHSGLSLLPPLSASSRARVTAELELPSANLRPHGTTFATGVREYLMTFGESAAAGMALIGALPFAEKLSNQDLAELIEFLRSTPELPALVSRMLRFAQDVNFDDSEPVSTGVVALAAERELSVVDIDARQLPKAHLDERLQKEWSTYRDELRERMEVILAPLEQRASLHRVVAEIVGTTCSIADALTSAPHKA